MNDPDDLIVRPDFTHGLEVYAERAKALAQALTATGPARGVVTFAQPVGPADLQQLADAGILIHTVEATSESNADGLRWTFGTRFGPSLQADLDSYGSRFRGDLAGSDIRGSHCSGHSGLPTAR